MPSSTRTTASLLGVLLLLAVAVAAAAAARPPAAAVAPAPSPTQQRLNFSFTLPPQQQQQLRRPVRKVTLRPTLGRRAVDGVERDLILIAKSGDNAGDTANPATTTTPTPTTPSFQPPLIVDQGDELELTLVNDLPSSWPQAGGGIVLHQHGWSMAGGQAAWHDGAASVSACVVPPSGGKRIDKFVVREPPGLYFFHDHSSLVRGDGLMGPLIVMPPYWAPKAPLAMLPGAGFGGDDPKLFPRAPGANPWEDPPPERVLFLADWWHYSADAMAMRFNRPFDPAKQQGDDKTGRWHWIGLPKSVLINGQSSYAACEDVTTRSLAKPMRSGALATADDLLLPDGVAGQLKGAAAFPVCNVTGMLTPAEAAAVGEKTPEGFGAPHVIDVPIGQTTLLRLVNAANLVYLTFCVRGHWLRVVAADAVPTQPYDAFECVDLNAGNRLDVLLVANATGASVGSTFWVSASPQYRKGAPTGYAVLRYVSPAASSSSSPPPLLDKLPPQEQMIQPSDAPARAKSLDTALRMHPLLLSATAADYPPAARLSRADRRRLDLAVQAVRGAGNGAPKWDSDEARRYGPPQALGGQAAKAAAAKFAPPRQVDRRFVLRTTQPVLEHNGFIRWALNNVASALTPDCPPLLHALYDEAKNKSTTAAGSFFERNRMNTSLTRTQLLLAQKAGGADDAYYAGAVNASTIYGPSSVEGVAVFDGAQDDDVLIRMQTPRSGLHVLSLPRLGESVEIVLQNERGGAYGGEYGEKDPTKNPAAGLVANRTGLEQHPMHLHGYHVFVVGSGTGRWTLADAEAYNIEGAPLRDTVTVLAPPAGAPAVGGWTAIRFRTSNVGVWPLRECWLLCSLMGCWSGRRRFSPPHSARALTLPSLAHPPPLAPLSTQTKTTTPHRLPRIRAPDARPARAPGRGRPGRARAATARARSRRLRRFCLLCLLRHHQAGGAALPLPIRAHAAARRQGHVWRAHGSRLERRVRDAAELAGGVGAALEVSRARALSVLSLSLSLFSAPSCPAL
jgi:FtsP/CotA-like multicopper oxidase with cupredoxin domain